MEDKRFVEKDLNYYLVEIINLNRLNDSVKGIAKRVMHEGIESLSEMEFFEFKGCINQHYIEKCINCDKNIRWTEMSAAEDNGSLCNSCLQKSIDLKTNS